MTEQSTSDSRIYLILPRALNQGILRSLDEILGKFAVSCVLVQESSDRSFDEDLVNSLVKSVQRHNVACLIENNCELAKKLSADGVHLTLAPVSGDESGSDGYEKHTRDYQSARKVLGDDAIIGALCADRHTAMIMGEEGAQYIALPAKVESDDVLTAHEQIQWWSELFELPCVAWDIKNPDEIEQFVQDGADFLAFEETVWTSDNPSEMLRTIASRIPADHH